MMIVFYLTILHLIISTIFVYGQGEIIDIEECLIVYRLLNKEPTNDCCWEDGILCEDGHIYGIFFKEKGLSGSIPAELGKLSHLQKLELQYNQFTGPIPSELGNLSQLEILDLSYNYLNGSIPEELGKLPELQEFWVEGNNLCGEIPIFLSKDCNVNVEKNKNIGKKCYFDKINKKIDAEDKNSSITTLIIISVCAFSLIIIIIIAFIYFKKNKNKNNKNNKNDNKSLSAINNSHSDNDNLHISENYLLNYTFIEKTYFEWKIENWNQLKDKEYSSTFEASEHLWKLMLITNSFNEDNKESLDVGLLLCDEIDKNEFIYANFIVYFRNYNNNQIYKEVKYDDIPTLYDANSSNHGINDVIMKSELYDKTNDGCSILENNKIIIGILIKFYSPNSFVVTNRY